MVASAGIPASGNDIATARLGNAEHILIWNRSLSAVALMDKSSACSEGANIRVIPPLGIRMEPRKAALYAVRPTQNRVTTLTMR